MNVTRLIRNISYSFFANFISLCGSVIMTIFVPKFMPIVDYGIWQLFLFYFSYMSFFHFGWSDGIYLRYAGKSFDELDSKVFAGQLYGLVCMELLLASLIWLFSKYFVEDYTKQNLLLYSAFLLPFLHFNAMCGFILQMTNKISGYAKIILTERVLLLAIVFLLLIIGYNSFYDLYYAKVISLLGASLFCVKICYRLLYFQFTSLKEFVYETFMNISAGIKLMFANIASMLIIGIVRYGVSVGWDVVTFGKVSLTLGISNFLMIFISAVSVAFFPILKHVEESKLAGLYVKLRSGLSAILLALLIFYYPIRCLLSWWLPQYEDSLVYMAVLFPVCIFESKMQLLVNTYLKSMRQEFLMLKINSIAVILSAIVTVVSVELFHNLDMTIFSVVFLYAIRCFYAEVKLQKLLGLHLGKDMVVECLLVGTFIAGGWIWDNFICMVIYGAAYMAYLAWNKKQITNLISIIKTI